MIQYCTCGPPSFRGGLQCRSTSRIKPSLVLNYHSRGQRDINSLLCIVDSRLYPIPYFFNVSYSHDFGMNTQIPRGRNGRPWRRSTERFSGHKKKGKKKILYTESQAVWSEHGDTSSKVTKVTIVCLLISIARWIGSKV